MSCVAIPIPAPSSEEKNVVTSVRLVGAFLHIALGSHFCARVKYKTISSQISLGIHNCLGYRSNLLCLNNTKSEPFKKGQIALQTSFVILSSEILQDHTGIQHGKCWSITQYRPFPTKLHFYSPGTFLKINQRQYFPIIYKLHHWYIIGGLIVLMALTDTALCYLTFQPCGSSCRAIIHFHSFFMFRKIIKLCLNTHW